VWEARRRSESQAQLGIRGAAGLPDADAGHRNCIKALISAAITTTLSDTHFATLTLRSAGKLQGCMAQT